MSSQREQMLVPMTLDALTDYMSNVSPGSQNAQMAQAELLRRQTVMQQDAAQATIDAAEAAKRPRGILAIMRATCCTR